MIEQDGILIRHTYADEYGYEYHVDIEQHIDFDAVDVLYRVRDDFGNIMHFHDFSVAWRVYKELCDEHIRYEYWFSDFGEKHLTVEDC